MDTQEESDNDERKALVWADGKWRTAGFVAYFLEAHDWLRQQVPSLPRYLPQQCVDPRQIARFFGKSLDDFDWQGPESSQVLAAIERVEQKLDGGSNRKSAIATGSQMLNTKDVSTLLGCSYSQARTLMLDGRIKSVKDGRLLRTRREWVEEYLLAQVVKKPDPQPDEIKANRPKAKLVGRFKKGGLAYEFLRSRPD